MIEVYVAGTGNGQRATVMLEECGLPHKVHKVDLAAGAQKSADFLKLNPAGAIPVLVDTEGAGGTRIVVSQSPAILVYLAEKTGKLMPKDPEERAAMWQWFAMAASDVGPSGGALFALANRVPEKSPPAIAFFENRLLSYFRVIDQRLGQSPYLAGKEMSIADLLLYPNVAGRRAMIEKAGDMKNLLAWADRMAARPGVSRGMAAAS